MLKKRTSQFQDQLFFFSFFFFNLSNLVLSALAALAVSSASRILQLWTPDATQTFFIALDRKLHDYICI